MSLLLDTQVLFWLLATPDRIPAKQRDLLSRPDTRLVASAASAWEVATKAASGRWDAARPLVDGWDDRLADLRVDQLSIDSRHAVLAGRLDWSHRDPFDRMLVAQSIIENLDLVSVDSAVVTFAGPRVLSW